MGSLPTVLPAMLWHYQRRRRPRPRPHRPYRRLLPRLHIGSPTAVAMVWVGIPNSTTCAMVQPPPLALAAMGVFVQMDARQVVLKVVHLVVPPSAQPLAISVSMHLAPFHAQIQHAHSFGLFVTQTLIPRPRRPRPRRRRHILHLERLYSSAGATLGPKILVGHTQASIRTVLPRRLWTTVFCAAARILFAQQ